MFRKSFFQKAVFKNSKEGIVGKTYSRQRELQVQRLCGSSSIEYLRNCKKGGVKWQ
jgi:hypothetical protein